MLMLTEVEEKILKMKNNKGKSDEYCADFDNIMVSINQLNHKRINKNQN